MGSSVQKFVIIFYTILFININKCIGSNVPVLSRTGIVGNNLPGIVATQGISPGMLQSGYSTNGLVMPIAGATAGMVPMTGMAPGMAPMTRMTPGMVSMAGISPGMTNPNLIMPGMAEFNFLPMLQTGNVVGQPLMPQTNIIKPVIEKGIVYGEEKKLENNHKYDNKNEAKKLNKYEKAMGSKGQAGGNAVQEFQAEQIGKKDKVSNVGFHNAIDSGHQKSADEKLYDGMKKYNKEGQSEDFMKSRKSYRKGHNKKGSKSSHSKDAAEKTETFYDEKHDQFGNINNNNNYGSYGLKEGGSYFGGFQNDHLNKQNAGQKGSFEKVSLKDNNKGEQGKFEQQGYNGQNQVYGTNAGLGMNAAKGLAENNGIQMHFVKAFPFF